MLNIRYKILKTSLCGYAVFQALCDSGIAVFTFDAEGFGLSEPLDSDARAVIDDYHYMVSGALIEVQASAGRRATSSCSLSNVSGVERHSSDSQLWCLV